MSKVAKFIGSVICAIGAFAYFTAAGFPQTNTAAPSLTSASNRIIDELIAGDYSAFDSNISTGGLLVIRREAVWNQSDPFSDRPIAIDPSGRADYLSFNGMAGTIWKEYEMSFNHPDIEDPQYRSVLRQFRGIVLSSADAYPTGIIASHSAIDEYDERHLGPCISGKMCSNVYWWIYLDIEHGKWKIWRMELYIH